MVIRSLEIRRLLKNLLLVVITISTLISTTSKAESVQLVLDDVTQFQNDGWSCGVQAAYRILNGGYGQSVDYVEMRSKVGSVNPIGVVLVPGVIEFSITFEELKIGQPTKELWESLHDNYRSNAVYTKASTEQIKDLLWKGIPVMVLIQQSSEGSIGLNHWEGCIGPWIFGDCWGIYYSVDMKHPVLHWIVAVGYDENYLYFKDTTDNSTHIYSLEEFEKRRNWSIDIYNHDIARLIEDRGAKIRHIIYFDEPIRHRIFSSGERYPNLIVNLEGFGRGKVTSNTGINCTGTCTSAILNKTTVNLKAIPESGSKFKYWTGACTGTGECTITINQTESVTAIFENPAIESTLLGIFNWLADDQDWDRAMNWAESIYPDLFPKKGKIENTVLPYYIRYYPLNNTYLKYNINDNHFYGYNPTIWGEDIVKFGTLSEYIAQVEQAGF